MRRLGPLLLAGCVFAPAAEPWWAQREASGPCYDANLLDGLDESSTAELHAVFACLDAQGALTAFRPLDVALDGSTRDGTLGLVLAAWVNDLPTAELSLSGLLEPIREVVSDPGEVLPWLHLGMELVYGAPWPWLGASVELAAPSSLERGVLVPGMEVAGSIATLLLDEGLDPIQPLRDALGGETTARLLWTAASVGDGDDATLVEMRSRWAPDIADLLARTRNSDNDRHDVDHGDSLRHLLDALLLDTGNDGRPVLEHLADPLLPVLEDAGAQLAVRSWLETEHAAGRVQQLPAWLLYLASVDTFGGGLSSGEDSALVSLVRLLHDANTPVDCSIDLIITSIDFSFGNLSVSLLETLAGLDPDAVDGGVGLLGTLLGFGLTDTILYGIADTGVCPVIDTQLVDDLHTLDRFNDDGMSGALVDLISLLQALDGHILSVVDVLSTAHDFELVPPVEELLRDTADAALVNDVLAWIPVLLEPDEHHDLRDFPEGVDPVDFDTLWDAAEVVLSPGDDGQTPLQVVAPLLVVGMGRSQTWEAVGNLGGLLAEPDAEIVGVLSMLRAPLELDPTLAWRADLVEVLGDEALVRLPLVLLESEDLRGALLQTELAAPGPIPFVATLVVGDTLDALLSVLDVFLSLLPEDP